MSISPGENGFTQLCLLPRSAPQKKRATTVGVVGGKHTTNSKGSEIFADFLLLGRIILGEGMSFFFLIEIVHGD